MDRALAAVRLCITGYFIFNIIRHMIAPGGNTDYTRMLLFACLGTICISLMLMVVGGPDRWPSIVEQAQVEGSRPLSMLALAGIITTAVILPIGLLIGLGVFLGLRLSFFMALFFVPVLMRLVTATSQQCIINGVIQILLFFATMLIGVGIVALVERHTSALQGYIRHFHKIWPGYDDMSSARMFFTAGSFALLNQIIEFVYAVLGIFGRKG
jgi:hypothetical protein